LVQSDVKRIVKNFDGLIDTEEKVASSSSKKTYPIQDQSAKTKPYLRPKWPKSIPYFRPKRLKNQALLGRTYVHLTNF